MKQAVKTIIGLLLTTLVILNPLPAPAQDQTLDYKILVLEPSLPSDNWDDAYTELYRAEIRKIFSSKPVELELLQPGPPEAISGRLETLGEDPLLRAVVLVQAPPGAAEGLTRLRARRPDIISIVVEPREPLARMAGAATLTLALNHAARGVIYPALAAKMGARTLVYFSLPRYLAHDQYGRQYRIMSRVAKDLGLILVSDIDGPNPGDPSVKRADVEEYLKAAASRYLRQYGPNTAFVSPSSIYTDILGPIIKDSGGSLLPSGRPSVLQGLPEALNMEEAALSNFGRWDMILSALDETVLKNQPQGQLAAWAAPYPHTALMAAVDLAVSAIEDQSDICDIDNIVALLKRQSPAANWAAAPYMNYQDEILLPQVILLLQDVYWLGHGYQGMTGMNLPSQYFFK